MKRRLLVVLSTLYRIRGGIQRFNRLLCRSIDELAPELEYSGTVISQDDERSDWPADEPSWRHLRFVEGGGKRGVARRTLAHCVRERPEALLIGHLGMTPLGVLCGPLLRRGYGFVAHGTEAWSVPRWSRRFAVRHASYALVVSRYTGDLLCRATGLQRDRLRLLPNALEPGLETVAHVDVAPPDGSTELLSVCRLSAEEGEKGVDHTLQVLPRLLDRHPDLRYRIVGRGNDKPRLVRLSESLGLTQRVIFEQDLSDDELVERYRRCSAFVLPSGQEGFGIVFLEAMRFGKPCIGGRAGGTPEVIADGESGLLVPFADLDALEKALDTLLRDGDLRRKMGASGRRRVEEHFVYPMYRARVREYLGEWLGLAPPRTGTGR